jgi:hypothetical protein
MQKTRRSARPRSITPLEPSPATVQQGAGHRRDDAGDAGALAQSIQSLEEQARQVERRAQIAALLMRSRRGAARTTQEMVALFGFIEDIGICMPEAVDEVRASVLQLCGCVQ